ncbi:MAG: FtsX-like permease family protein [Pseudomonadota bacterium]
MSELWRELPAVAQDSLVLLVFVVPAILVGSLVVRGFAPGPLVRALLWRFRWANAMFVALIAVSVGMGIGLLAQERGLRVGTAEAARKFDLIVSAPGSELTMLFAAVFLQPSDVPLLDGETYNSVANHNNVALAAPLAFGDSVGDSPVVGTTWDLVDHLTDGAYAGRAWARSDEAIIGATVPLNIGDVFVPAHGHGATADASAHEGTEITVVGRMAPTGSPWDRAVLTPVESVWEVHGLANGHAPERGDQIGPPFDAPYFPGTPAIIVQADALWANYALRSEFTRENETMAFFPGAVLANLFEVMGDIRQVMSLMALVTQVLVACSVLLGLFILSRLFRRQIAVLRALGAPARFVFAVVWSYGAILLTVGALLGVAAGYLAVVALSRLVTLRTDIAVTAQLGWSEIHFVAAFFTLTSLLSLLPALLVLRQPVVDGLRT